MPGTPASPSPSHGATPQLGLFAPPMPSPVEETLRAIDLDDLSPRAAFDLVARLRKML
jgi:DNA mismatch repair protein MutS